jgi:transposase
MSGKTAVFGEAERLEILAAQKKQHSVHVTRRLLALKLKVVDGLRSEEAGKIAGMHTTSVNRIVKRYQEEGIEAIVGVRHHSKHHYMSREEEAAFLSQF